MEGTLISSYEMETGILLMLAGPLLYLLRGPGMLGTFLRCSKGVKDPFEVQEGRCDLPGNSSAEKGLISSGGESLLDFLKLWHLPLEL